jgi:hypothetical protein
MRKNAKFSFYFFAKNNENQAKRIAFRFEMRNNKTKKEAKRAHPTRSVHTVSTVDQKIRSKLSTISKKVRH